MRNSGRVTILTVGGIMALLLVLAVVVFAKAGPDSAGVKFMDALARHDVDQLVEMTYVGETDLQKIADRKKKLREDWDFCVNTAGKHFIFTWKIVGYTQPKENAGAVSCKIIKNPQMGGYEEKYELPMEKEGGQWRVVVGGISRSMFPALPK
jgi:hypothetical protein